MLEIKREEINLDPIWHRLKMIILQMHKPADHTYKVMMENAGIKDFCEESRTFVYIPVKDKHPIYLHYDMSTWMPEPMRFAYKVESITIYDTFLEYESARNKQLHGSKTSSIPNIN